MSAEIPAHRPLPPRRRILGVDFFIGTIDEAVAQALAGGLVVAPSAPGLAKDLVESPVYREALGTADLVITDSGLMVLLWCLFTGERLPRHSGLKLMRAVLARSELKRPGAVFWVMPSQAESERNLAWLAARGFSICPEDVYVAPHYGPGVIDDPELGRRLAGRSPQVVMLAIGGGVQERLGLALRSTLPDRPAILCLGAAIAFLTGGQVAIPAWADRLYLGWLLRLVGSPRKFWPKCILALRLIPVLWRWRERSPGAA